MAKFFRGMSAKVNLTQTVVGMRGSSVSEIKGGTLVKVVRVDAKSGEVLIQGPTELMAWVKPELLEVVG